MHANYLEPIQHALQIGTVIEVLNLLCAH